MAVRPIVITGNPVLHSPAEPVAEITPDIAALLDDMNDTMHAAPGVGLAAPQLGVGLRVFVYSWEDESGTLHEGTALNPELWIAPTSTAPLDHEAEAEGCLSVPGERFGLRRSPDAILRATDADGHQYEKRASGWLARIWQHEYDHLDGVLYVDRLDAPEHRLAAKAIRKNKWGVTGLEWLPGVDDLEG